MNDEVVCSSSADLGNVLLRDELTVFPNLLCDSEQRTKLVIDVGFLEGRVPHSPKHIRQFLAIIVYQMKRYLCAWRSEQSVQPFAHETCVAMISLSIRVNDEGPRNTFSASAVRWRPVRGYAIIGSTMPGASSGKGICGIRLLRPPALQHLSPRATSSGRNDR